MKTENTSLKAFANSATAKNRIPINLVIMFQGLQCKIYRFNFWQVRKFLFFCCFYFNQKGFFYAIAATGWDSQYTLNWQML